MKETYPLAAENNFDVKEEHKRFRKNLYRRIQRAHANAPKVTFDSETNDIREFLELANKNGQKFAKIKDEDVLELTYSTDPNCVFVEDAHNYPLLLTLAAIEILKVNENLSPSEAKRLFYEDEEAIEWFQKGLEYETAHEAGHFLGAVEFTDLTFRLGVEFFIEESSYHNF